MIIAIVVGVLNFFALAFLGWQTLLTRRSVQLAERSIQEGQRVRELSDLPKANLVIHAQLQIQKWRTDLQQLVEDEAYIRTQIKANDHALGIKYGIKSPKGLIIKPLYDISPSWLQIIVITAAQYYYDCKALASSLSPTKEPELALSLLPDIVDRAKVGIIRMTELLSYIEKMVPEWYLESPASLKDSDFMDR